MERTDHAAAAIHRAQAERHYVAAEKFRKLGLKTAERQAREAARWEDGIAEVLSGYRR